MHPEERADWEITKQAAMFKTKARMAYADCSAAALAKLRKAELVTGAPEFKQVEGETKVVWL
jgi:predicted nucleic acid-binding protein